MAHKRRAASRLIIGVAVSVALVSACASGPYPNGRGAHTLSGVVYSEGGKPVRGADVAVDGGRRARTDYLGRFVLARVRRGSRTVRVESARHLSETRSISFTGAGQALYIRLAPLRPEIDRLRSLISEGELRRAYGLSIELLAKLSRREHHLEQPLHQSAILLAAFLSIRLSELDRARSLLAMLPESLPEHALLRIAVEQSESQ